jgi:hypothetical protein
MAIEATPETLLKLQTEITVVRAQHTDLTWKVRQRRLVEHARLEASTIARAHRIRDQLLTAPARHAALLAAQHGIGAAALSSALEDFVRTTLREIAAGPG